VGVGAGEGVGVGVGVGGAGEGGGDDGTQPDSAMPTKKIDKTTSAFPCQFLPILH